jgi:MFS family permease
MSLIAAITFLSPFASSIFAPAIPFVNADFENTSKLLGSFSISIFVLGFAVSSHISPFAF